MILVELGDSARSTCRSSRIALLERTQDKPYTDLILLIFMSYFHLLVTAPSLRYSESMPTFDTCSPRMRRIDGGSTAKAGRKALSQSQGLDEGDYCFSRAYFLSHAILSICLDTSLLHLNIAWRIDITFSRQPDYPIYSVCDGFVALRHCISCEELLGSGDPLVRQLQIPLVSRPNPILTASSRPELSRSSYAPLLGR